MMPVNDATLEIFFGKFMTPERKEKYHIFKIAKERNSRGRAGKGLVPGISVCAAGKMTQEEKTRLVNDFYDEYARFFAGSQQPFADVVCTAEYLCSYGGKYYQMRSVNRSKNHNDFGFGDYDIYQIDEEDYYALLLERYPQYKMAESGVLVRSFDSENEETVSIYRTLLHEGLTEDVMEKIING